MIKLHTKTSKGKQTPHIFCQGCVAWESPHATFFPVTPTLFTEAYPLTSKIQSFFGDFSFPSSVRRDNKLVFFLLCS